MSEMVMSKSINPSMILHHHCSFWKLMGDKPAGSGENGIFKICQVFLDS